MEHISHGTMSSLFPHMVRFAGCVLLACFATLAMPAAGMKVHASDRGGVGIPTAQSESKTPKSGSVAGPDHSEDLISGLRSLRRIRTPAYTRGSAGIRPRGGFVTGDAPRSVTRTRQDLQRSMKSIDDSVRSMNTSINRIRTYRRRF